MLFFSDCIYQHGLAYSKDTSSGSGVCMPSVKRLELLSQRGCTKACRHAHTYACMQAHTRTSNQTSLNPHMQAGVRPKNNPVLPQVQLFSLLYKGNCRIQDNHEQLFAFFPSALPWQQGKMRKIIISWS